jgi:hypothetical protein
MKTKKREFINTPSFPMSIETFRNVSGYTLKSWEETNPTCFNGMVSVKKFRITVEEVDEPNEVIADRIKMLWRKCNNYHHWEPLRAVANKHGVTLDDSERGVEK